MDTILKQPVLLAVALLLFAGRSPELCAEETNPYLPLVIVPEDKLFGGWADEHGRSILLTDLWEYTATIPENERAVARSRGANTAGLVALGIFLGAVTTDIVLSLSNNYDPTMSLVLRASAATSILALPIFTSIRDHAAERAVHVYNNRDKPQSGNE